MKLTVKQILKHFKNPWKDAESFRDIRTKEDAYFLAEAIIKALVEAVNENTKKD